ncbi:MAG: ABC transporter permease subunit [Gemmatimonadota bacterium]
MLFHIVRKELLDQLLSLRFAIACAICLVVFVLSSLVLTRDYREAMSTYHMNEVMHRNELLQRTEVFSLFQGVTVDRPLNPMNVLVRGVAGSLTESIRVQQGNRLDFPETYEQNPVLPLFPDVDFVFIVGIIMSLLALAFAYDAVSGERESGVLKLVLSYSAPRDAVLLGKWLGGYLALVAPFVTGLLVALLIAALLPEVDTSLADSLAILALLGLALLYLAAIYSLGVLVSCRTSLPSTSITVLLLVWVVLILAVPNMAPYLTSQIMPVPSRESVDRVKAELQREQVGQLLQRVEEWKKEKGLPADANWYQDEDLRARAQEYGTQMQDGLQKVEDDYLARVQSQTRWSGLVARLSPLTSLKLAAYDLAAAGIAQESALVQDLKTYSKTWEEYSNEKQKAWREFMEKQMSSGGAVSFTPEMMERFRLADLSDYPRFSFAYMPLSRRLSLASLDLGLLAIWSVLFFLAAYLSFLRYDAQ